MQEDEWRVEIELDDEQHGYSLGERLRALDLDDDARTRLGEAIIVTRDGSRVFLYAAQEQHAREAERIARELLASDRLSARISRTRWHPIEEEWKDAAIPLPGTDSERAEERARHEAAEAHEAEVEGSYDWNVRVDLPHRRDATEVEARLRGAGRPVRRRWKYLTIGALTEERANELAAELADELPPDTEVWVEANPDDLPAPLFVFLGSRF